MSICSAMSDMSVSYCGSEMPLEQALDECFVSLQDTLNHLHCYVRELGMLPEQDSDYMVGLDKVLQINDGIDDMTDLFKELKSVSKQVIGNPDKSIKEEVKKKIETHKANRKADKLTTL